MSAKQPIATPAAPKAIGTYSQAVRAGQTVYLSGQIPLNPQTMELEAGDMRAQIARVFDNLRAVARAAGGDFKDVVKLNVFLTVLMTASTVCRNSKEGSRAQEKSEPATEIRQASGARP